MNYFHSSVIDAKCIFLGANDLVLPTGVTCGFPGKPTNGQVSSGGSSHVYGTRVTYSCDAGYTRQGVPDNVCQNNGQWRSAVPTCRRE